MTPTLAEIQATLAASILEPGAAIPASWLRVPDGVDVSARIAVYTEGYPARIEESLRESHPAIAKILGDAAFASLCERYVAKLDRPPRNLNSIGIGLPSFITGDALARELPFLGDLARFESAIQCCFHSRPLPPFDPTPCAGWDFERWQEARIRLQPDMVVIRSDWPLRALRDAKDQERDSIDIDLSPQPDRLLVRRQELDVVTESICEHEADAIERLRSGETLGEVTEALATASADEDAVGRFFSRWASLGLVVSCE